MEGDVTSGVLVIGGEGPDEGEQDEGKGEEGESLQQPKTIQRRERGGGGARNPFTLSQRPLHIISRHDPDNPGYPLPVFTLRYPLSHSTPLSPSCDHVPATPCVDHHVVCVTSFPRRRPTHSVPVPPLPRPSPSSPFVLPSLLVSVAFSHRNFLPTASSVMNSIPYASYRNPSHFISLSLFTLRASRLPPLSHQIISIRSKNK